MEFGVDRDVQQQRAVAVEVGAARETQAARQMRDAAHLLEAQFQVLTLSKDKGRIRPIWLSYKIQTLNCIKAFGGRQDGYCCKNQKIPKAHSRPTQFVVRLRKKNRHRQFRLLIHNRIPVAENFSLRIARVFLSLAAKHMRAHKCLNCIARAMSEGCALMRRILAERLDFGRSATSYAKHENTRDDAQRRR